MKLIKFRGKRKDNGEWVYGYYDGWVRCPVIRESDGYAREVRAQTVGQYIGLNDSTKWEELTKAEQKKWLATGKTAKEWSGKEIYEGDILTRGEFVSDGVYFDESIAAYFTWWRYRYPKDGERKDAFAGGYIASCEKKNSYKVIGNIHDNPELLEEK